MTREKKRSSRFFRGVKSFLLLSNRNQGSNNFNSSNDDVQQQENNNNIYAREGVAVTLTTEFNANNNNNNAAVTLLNSNLSFMPCQPMSSSCFENKAYVHYEPKKAQVALGTNPDAKHRKSLKLTVEQYAWIIQQLQEEQGVFNSLESIFNNSDQLLWNISPMLGVLSNSVSSHSKSLGKRLMRFVQQKRKSLMMSVPPQLSQYQLQCIFMLPKALLLQAAAYIPMTKPLPPPLSPIQYHLLSNHPYKPVSKACHTKITRYCNHILLCAHELLPVTTTIASCDIQSEPSPPPSLINSINNKPIETCKIHCADCSIHTYNLQTILPTANKQPINQELSNSSVPARLITTPLIKDRQHQSIMFPVSFIQYTSMALSNTLINSQQKLNNQQMLLLQKQETEKQKQLEAQQQQQQKVFMTSAIQPSSRKVAFDSFSKRQKPHAVSAFQYIPPDRTMSSSSISSISQYSGIEEEEDVEENDDYDQDNMYDEDEDEEESNDVDDENGDLSPQKYGYVAIDSENEEILVVFPGMAMSHNLFENASFASVPWQEIEYVVIDPSTDRKNPEDDASPWVLECALTAWNRCEMKVVTLLMRLCSVMPSHYKVVIIGYSIGGAVAALCASSLRSTKLLMNRSITVCAIHSPRVGNKAFLLSLSNQKVETIRVTHYKDLMAHLPPRTSGLFHIGDTTVILPPTAQDNGHVIEDLSTSEIEDVLDKTFPFKDYDLKYHSKVWDLNLDEKVNTCII
ncbi:unnamed protein product [Mucor hiemalis]